MRTLRGSSLAFVLTGLVLIVTSACGSDTKNKDDENKAGAGGTSEPEGGASATGGKSNKGGNGGASAKGGSSAKGGNSAKGGAAATGGTAASSGGTTSTGGTSTGGAATGGNSATGGTTATVVLPGVPILKYEFEDGVDTKVTDTTGNGRDAVLSGATWSPNTDGRDGIAASFATGTAAIALPKDVLKSASGLTVSAWVKLTANAAGNRLFDVGSGPGNHVYFTFNNRANAMELGIQVNDGEVKTLVTPAMLPLNVWKHVAVELSPLGARIYVDGWQVAKDTSITDVPSALGSTSSNWIGKSQVAEDGTFAGLIDKFYIDDNPISVADRRQRAWPKTDYSIWHFDEVLGTTATDSSDNLRHGTLKNLATDDTGWGVGIDGGALRLVNDTNTPNGEHVELPNGVLQNCTSGMTISAWIALTTNYPHMRVFDFGVPGAAVDSTKEIFGRTMGGSTKHWCFGTKTVATAATVTAANLDWDPNAAWANARWYHVAAVRDGQEAHVYVDGVQTLPTPYPNRTPNPNTTLPDHLPPSSLGANSISLIGAPITSVVGTTVVSYSDSGGASFNGRIDEFILSCRAYTADEIKLLAVKP